MFFLKIVKFTKKGYFLYSIVVENIKKIRKDSGLKQIDFAKLLNIKPTIIENIESNRRKVDTELVEVIAKKLNISPNWLILGLEPKELGRSDRSAADDYQITKRSLKLRILEFHQKITFFGDAYTRYLYEYWKHAINHLQEEATTDNPKLEKVQNAIKKANPDFSLWDFSGLAKITPEKTLSYALDFFETFTDPELEFIIHHQYEFLEIINTKL